ncbi:ChbG/HpnK family deacetylase [Paenibacillus sp. JJ-223]|uniref:carbohydrate deacetylase n=1 Tax=Paenibacillus sp. JJ-223 TaxID=2905647 RepID=UPI001F460C18|nr:ChbG/HpnK family deacetylase [Paenibacillus sp. JJ-223]CAH1211494.1 Chitooligosaccharide deacetylase [Paenibacillus sp. JJ-223]
MRWLIINADDFGLSEGTNRGIEEAHRAGSLSSATLMVNMPGFPDAVNRANTLPELGVGLHFNLTYGKPISDPQHVPSLVKPDGTFNGIHTMSSWNECEIELELAAQWERFVTAGLKPTHLDSHHHLHLHDHAVHRAMSTFALRHQVPMRKSRLSAVSATPVPLTTDYILLDTYDKQDSLKRLIRAIAHLPKGSTEIMCHPGYVDDTTRKISNYTQGRELELNVFRSRSIHQALAKHGVRLIHFGQLAAAKTATMPLIHKPLRAPGIHVKPRHPKRSTKRKSILVKNRRKKNGSSSFDRSHSFRLTKSKK